MDRKTAKTWIMMMLLVGSLACIVAAGRTNTAVHASSSVSASSVLPPKDWSQTYGGSSDDYAFSMIKPSDGGYVLAGFTDSSGAGGFDFYLVKADSAGNQNWTQTYGGVGDDKAYSVIQTADGGYALAGYTTSSSIDVINSWLVKTDSTGNEQWNQIYGSTGDTEAYSVVQTSDGGYALGGYTDASGAGGYDVWLVKTDSIGGVQWSQTYGGSGDDYAYSVVQTSDGGYVLAGFTDSSGTGGFDFYLVKTDAAGTSSPGSGFNLSSIEGYLVLGGITILIIGIAFFIVSRRKK